MPPVNKEALALDAATMSSSELGIKYGCSANYALVVCKRYAVRPVKKHGRNVEVESRVLHLRTSGYTMQEIANIIGKSKQRVHQILRRSETESVMRYGDQGTEMFSEMFSTGLRRKTIMNTYQVYDGSRLDEGACLVFAPNRKEALRLGRPVVLNWFPDARWIDVRARRLQGDYAHHRTADGPHVVESPEACYSCCKWGPDPLEASGLCTPCTNGEDEW